MPQSARKCRLTPWMNFASGKRHAVTGDHNQRVGNCRTRGLFRNRENNDGASFLAILLESFSRQSFAGFRPLDVFECDVLAVLSSGIVYGCLELSGSCLIRIVLC